MSSSEWESVERLFHEARELPDAERIALLAGEPEEVRGAVMNLLRHSGDDDKIERAISSAARALTQPSGVAGAYRIVKEIGRGGMGAVYLGARADDVFDKNVAIKFVRTGMDSPALLRRFDEERRILARLEHPNIARLIDGGATPEGQPYLVMEYVEGTSITEYVRTAGIDVRGRIGLFLDVCAAVHYAHQHLVVHRDLKPGNIAIDSSGRPKLLDFGIARLHSADSDRTGEGTVARLLTPDYASPEQLRGTPVSTASDVYSLGAVLYELLAGERPFHLDGLTPAEAERAVTSGRLVKPSLRTPTARHELNADLDNIVMKAMRPEPLERYASAADLAADLDRYLEGRPVLARDYRPWERGWKFVSRHRTGTVAALAVAASLVTGVLLADRSSKRAAHERQVAAEERRRAAASARQADDQRQAATDAKVTAESRFRNEVDAMEHVLSDLQAMHGLPGNDAARRGGLEKALKSIEQLQREAPGDTRVRFLRANAWQQLGHIDARDNGGPAETKRGIELLKKASAEYRSLLTAAGVPPPEIVKRLVEACTDLGHVISGDTDDQTEAAPYYAEAERLSRAELQRNPSDPALKLMLAEVLGCRALAIQQQSPGKMSPDEIHGFRKLLEDAVGSGPENPDRLTELGDIVVAEGLAYRDRGMHKQSLTEFETALVLRQKALVLEPLDVSALHNLNVVYSDLIGAHRSLEGPKAPKIEEYAEKMAAIGERLGADPSDRSGQIDLAGSQARLAAARYAKGDFQGALAPAQRAVTVIGKLIAAGEKGQGVVHNFASYSLTLGRVLAKLQRGDEAASAWKAALAEAEAFIARGKPIPFTFYYAANAASSLAEVYAERGMTEALPLADLGIAYGEKTVAASPDTMFQGILAELIGDGAIAYSNVAAHGHEEASSQAHKLAVRSMELASRLKDSDMLLWPKEDREKVKALADK